VFKHYSVPEFDETGTYQD